MLSVCRAEVIIRRILWCFMLSIIIGMLNLTAWKWVKPQQKDLEVGQTFIIALKWGINKLDVHRMEEKLAHGNYPFYFISLHNFIFFVLTLFGYLDGYTYLIIVKFLCCFMFIFSLSQRNVFVLFTFKIST